MQMSTIFLFAQLLLVLTSAAGEWKDTTWDQNPYMVALRYQGKHHCGGSIIAKNLQRFDSKHGVILTAAHCLDLRSTIDYPQYDMDYYEVWIGCTKTDCTTNARKYQIQEIVYHPKWRSNYLIQGLHDNYAEFAENDIALIYLTEPITYPSNAQTITLESTMSLQNNDKIKVLGYSGLGSSDIDTLEYMITNYMPNSECDNYFGVRDGNQVTGSNEFCVKDDNGNDGIQGTCEGDSGSPYIRDGKQIGICSFTVDGCDPNKPQVATSVPYFYNWIKNTLNDDSHPFDTIYMGRNCKHFTVLSVDHKFYYDSTKYAEYYWGFYFNFDIQAVENALGFTLRNSLRTKLFNDRTKTVRSVVMWDNKNGGSNGNGHGRVDPYDKAGFQDWQIGDKIMFEDCNLEYTDSIIECGSKGDFIKCDMGIMTGACGSGANPDGFYSGLCPKVLGWTGIECSTINGELTDVNNFQNDKWKCGGYGKRLECNNKESMVGLCGAGEHDDCQQYCSGWSGILCSTDYDDYIGINNNCIWLQEINWGKLKKCPIGYVMTGYCGSGKNRDCNGNAFEIKCCK